MNLQGEKEAREIIFPLKEIRLLLLRWLFFIHHRGFRDGEVVKMRQESKRERESEGNRWKAKNLRDHKLIHCSHSLARRFSKSSLNRFLNQVAAHL